MFGAEKVALTTPWAGYRWGPVVLPGREVAVLPTVSHYRSGGEAPQPIGLIGAHRSRRDGDGTEFSSIRRFHAGDRLRRINWRVSLRQGTLHVESTRAEEDTAVLLIVDAWPTTGTPRASAVRRAVSTSPCGPLPRWPTSTSAVATGSRSASSAPAVSTPATASGPATCAGS